MYHVTSHRLVEISVPRAILSEHGNVLVCHIQLLASKEDFDTLRRCELGLVVHLPSPGLYRGKRGVRAR